ncbi:hypothetical protein DIPPA_17635 [Diplonema papillatum]|nr:hypothetical protein DIPPA_17635 [Diplonema papillatum]KAJ9443191.1 hypothetical protein DIPPA_17635 [Diplonema papillatum]
MAPPQLKTTVQLWENERWYPIGGWASLLLPADPPHWADGKGREKRMLGFPVPTVEGVESSKCEWQNAWHVQTGLGTDEDGWSYAKAFHAGTWRARPPMSSVVRKRMWVRDAVVMAEHLGTPGLHSPLEGELGFDDPSRHPSPMKGIYAQEPHSPPFRIVSPWLQRSLVVDSRGFAFFSSKTHATFRLVNFSIAHVVDGFIKGYLQPKTSHTGSTMGNTRLVVRKHPGRALWGLDADSKSLQEWQIKKRVLFVDRDEVVQGEDVQARLIVDVNGVPKSQLQVYFEARDAPQVIPGFDCGKGTGWLCDQICEKRACVCAFAVKHGDRYKSPATPCVALQSFGDASEHGGSNLSFGSETSTTQLSSTQPRSECCSPVAGDHRPCHRCQHPRSFALECSHRVCNHCAIAGARELSKWLAGSAERAEIHSLIADPYTSIYVCGVCTEPTHISFDELDWTMALLNTAEAPPLIWTVETVYENQRWLPFVNEFSVAGLLPTCRGAWSTEAGEERTKPQEVTPLMTANKELKPVCSWIQGAWQYRSNWHGIDSWSTSVGASKFVRRRKWCRLLVDTRATAQLRRGRKTELMLAQGRQAEKQAEHSSEDDNQHSPHLDVAWPAGSCAPWIGAAAEDEPPESPAERIPEMTLATANYIVKA